jgi:hypothetical protein
LVALEVVGAKLALALASARAVAPTLSLYLLRTWWTKSAFSLIPCSTAAATTSAAGISPGWDKMNCVVALSLRPRLVRGVAVPALATLDVVAAGAGTALVRAARPAALAFCRRRTTAEFTLTSCTGAGASVAVTSLGCATTILILGLDLRPRMVRGLVVVMRLFLVLFVFAAMSFRSAPAGLVAL